MTLCILVVLWKIRNFHIIPVFKASDNSDHSKRILPQYLEWEN